MSWLSSWLPELQLPSLNLNLTLPSSIQARFLSFVLKRSLGHFFKPGQLDAHQIDSQIGSGFVQVNELELDNTAINALLTGIPFTLSAGSLSSATVRVPWPNPLTSTLGFSLSSLHLTFELSSTTPEVSEIDLAASVASVAETFLHEELSPREEASLMDSLHLDHPLGAEGLDNDMVPGGLDPFDVRTGEESRPETEPGGISLFATLIERLLSRFEFDAQDIRITIIHPENVSLTVTLSEIKYSANVQQPTIPTKSPTEAEAVMRSLTINGVSLHMKDLRTFVTRSSPFVTHSPISSQPDLRHCEMGSPHSSTSSLDEETTMAMSQSLASLPPRPISPSSSVASSMYQSALSIVGEEAEEEEPLDYEQRQPTPVLSAETSTPHAAHAPVAKEDEMILSSGSSALTVRICTSPPTHEETEHGSGKDRLTISTQTGLFACGLRSWHISCLIRLASTVTSKLAAVTPQPRTPTATTNTVPISAFDVNVSLDIRGFVLLLLPPELNPANEDNLHHFFLRPLIPPSIPSGYLRIHVEGISASTFTSSASNGHTNVGVRSTDSMQMNGHFSVHSLNAFVFKSSSIETNSNEVSAFPVLFIDHNLTTSYSSPHIAPTSSDGTIDNPLPQFEVIDWTDPEHQRKGAARLSYWRCKMNTRQNTSHGQHGPNSLSSPPSQTQVLVDQGPIEPAIIFKFERSQSSTVSTQTSVDGTIAPLHLLVDLNTVFGDDTALRYVEEIASSVDAALKLMDDEEIDDPERTPPTSPGINMQQQWKHMEFDDFNKSDRGRRHTEKNSSNLQSQPQLKDELYLSLHVPLTRLELRVPPPRDIQRSGAITIDIHNINLGNGLKKGESRARFSSPEMDPGSNKVAGQPILHAELGRLVVSHSLVKQRLATALLSIGPLADDDLSNTGNHHEALWPRISLNKSQISSGSITALNAEVPSAHGVITKELLDGLQYFIDDASQMLERWSQRMNQEEKSREGDDTSMIGSHFFVKSRSGSGSNLMNSSASSSSETVLKLVISETFLRLWVPRTDSETQNTRPFDIETSDLNVLIELKPEGREETVITLGVLDTKIRNHAKAGKIETLLALTSPRSLMSTPRPLVKLRFVSLMAPGTTAKETRLKLTMCDFTCNIFPDHEWVKDLGLFVQSPPGTFESVIPTERTTISLKVMDGSIRAYAPTKPGAITLYIGDINVTTEVSGKSLESTFGIGIQYLALLAIDDVNNYSDDGDTARGSKGVALWKSYGFALIGEIAEAQTTVIVTKELPVHVDVVADGVQVHLHLAADTLPVLSVLINDISSSFSNPEEDVPPVSREPIILSQKNTSSGNLMASVEDIAFHRPPEIGPAPDMIHDDLPTNMEYLDESFGAAAGLREFSDDELDDLEDEHTDREVRPVAHTGVGPGETSNVNGETIKVFSEGITIIEDYYDNLPAEVSNSPLGSAESKLRIRVHEGDVALLLYDGYDWVRTRKIIEEEVKDMRRRLAKIRQLVANGQVQDSDMEDTSAVLFNSVYIGLDQDFDAEEPGELLAAIDEELKEDIETSTQSSWQSMGPNTAGASGRQHSKAPKVRGKRLTRSKGPSMEFKLMGLNADVNQFLPDDMLVSQTSVTVRDLEILDHIKTSTWKKFLTALRSDSRGNIRETESDMVKIELRGVRPAPGHPSEEARLRAKLLPLRLYVDQDAVDFLKKFFSFKDPNEVPAEPKQPAPEAYIQLAEIFPIDLKLDYKPRRVDYRALREGRTIELMNFFHFDGAEMTLRHITMAGVTGWARLFEMLNDLWTPDVKATQLVDVISGVAPIRSVVNVGSGVADLVLLPISQYKKDGRIVRGVQKGATAFVKSTAMEAIKMGARLATGTQVILEQAESVLGGQYKDAYMTESLDETGRILTGSGDDELDTEIISKYAEQPTDIREGVQFAYQSMRRNLNSAAQTILAVPMEVYERSGNEGPVRSVIRAVPIAVLKPMIGASEAVSKTLLGLHNSMDPNARRENEAKYKHR